MRGIGLCLMGRRLSAQRQIPRQVSLTRGPVIPRFRARMRPPHIQQGHTRRSGSAMATGTPGSNATDQKCIHHLLRAAESGKEFGLLEELCDEASLKKRSDPRIYGDTYGGSCARRLLIFRSWKTDRAERRLTCHFDGGLGRFLQGGPGLSFRSI